MRYRPPHDPPWAYDPNTMHSLGATFMTSILGAVVTVAFVLAVLYPLTALSVVVSVVAGGLGVRTLYRIHRTRQRTGQTRHVQLPLTDIAVEL